MKLAVIGAGWGGCAAAVEATRLGHAVTVFDASRTAGGRARRVETSHEGRPLALDNGQHILIGAYTETLGLMARLGIGVDTALMRLPLRLTFPDGSGLRCPHAPPPLDALAGIVSARGWSWRDKLSLLQAALRWRLAGFACGPGESVADLCRGIRPVVRQQLIEPLCISALNTPAPQASGAVFLRVLRDALFGASGGSNLLLPRVDLTALLPDAALCRVVADGGTVRLGARVQQVTRASDGWRVFAAGEETFDAVILACPVNEAWRLAHGSGAASTDWLADAQGLSHEALTTVYAWAPTPDGRSLDEPMLALHSDRDNPAQFVFDRGQLGGPPGLLAFVISASSGDAAALTQQVLAQALRQLQLKLQAVQTIVEKRATFSCTPGLTRPAMQVAPNLFACGDYVAGPYPATLEGAVRSGLRAARALAQSA